MARMLSHFIGRDNGRVSVLVATSGDTGSAVANGFLGVEGIDVVVLYPKKAKGKVSEIQEKQFTTLGGTLRPLRSTARSTTANGWSKALSSIGN